MFVFFCFIVSCPFESSLELLVPSLWSLCAWMSADTTPSQKCKVTMPFPTHLGKQSFRENHRNVWMSWSQVWNRKKDPNEFFWKIETHFWVVMLAKSLYNISTKFLAQKQTLKVPSRWPGACAIASGDGPMWPATVINFGWDEDHPSMDIDLSKSRESKFYEKMQVM